MRSYFRHTVMVPFPILDGTLLIQLGLVNEQIPLFNSASLLLPPHLNLSLRNTSGHPHTRHPTCNKD